MNCTQELDFTITDTYVRNPVFGPQRTPIFWE